ncbi:MAG TPA: SUMF1/EgtB/PvdO family nonheme iron enzyme [Pirellulales bacterium]|jgi:formylglycine-generating enzyme required for sulfatase activity|nr:SUMF1/EgtB/PvdO family nonheme iron enzyme [Pirellulales bacterium]
MRQSIVFRNAALALMALLAVIAANARAVNIAWSPVGNPGNATDGTGFGSVAYNYNIGTYDVTNSQYVEFLNAKDPNGTSPIQLYNSVMSHPNYGGINYNSGNANGSKYSVIPGNGNHPVNAVTWYDTIRFANWLNNGQGNGDTETGAYTLLGATPTPSNGNSITRTVGATIFLTSENEWYKAAYYNPATNSYYQYPTSSNTTPIGSNPTALPNHVNVNPGAPGSNLTDVGAYTGTTSPYGAFDMGGNIFQWNEALNFFDTFAYRGLRGGAFYNSSFRSSDRFTNPPYDEDIGTGFRLANIPTGYVIPEPSSLVLAALGFVALAAWRLRRR